MQPACVGKRTAFHSLINNFTLCPTWPRGACKFGTFQNSDINNFDNSGGNEGRGHIYMTRRSVRNTNGGFKLQSVRREILQKKGCRWQMEQCHWGTMYFREETRKFPSIAVFTQLDRFPLTVAKIVSSAMLIWWGLATTVPLFCFAWVSAKYWLQCYI